MYLNADWLAAEIKKLAPSAVVKALPVDAMHPNLYNSTLCMVPMLKAGCLKAAGTCYEGGPGWPNCTLNAGMYDWYTGALSRELLPMTLSGHCPNDSYLSMLHAVCQSDSALRCHRPTLRCMLQSLFCSPTPARPSAPAAVRHTSRPTSGSALLRITRCLILRHRSSPCSRWCRPGENSFLSNRGSPPYSHCH